MTRNEPAIAIIGGGIGGLAAACLVPNDLCATIGLI
jgi:cation diffusion facilitator CzcD-associated flavoprotein CzcO